MVGPDYERLIGTDIETQRRSSALFLLKLKESRRLTQVANDDVVEGSQLLFTQTTNRLYAGVKEKLAQDGLEVEDLDTVFRSLVDPFNGLETQYKQEHYYVEHLGLIVSS